MNVVSPHKVIAFNAKSLEKYIFPGSLIGFLNLEYGGLLFQGQAGGKVEEIIVVIVNGCDGNRRGGGMEPNRSAN